MSLLAQPILTHSQTSKRFAQLIMDKHQVSGMHGLYLYLGTEADATQAAAAEARR